MSEASFSWKIPERFNFATDVVDSWAMDPDLLAVMESTASENEVCFTYKQISEQSKRMASMLAEMSLQQGDRVIVMLPRIHEWVVAVISCLRMGCIPIPCITMLTKSDLAYRVKHSGARAVVTTINEIAKFDDLDDLSIRVSVGGSSKSWRDYSEVNSYSPHFDAAEVKVDDPSVMYYTSGSTGSPKGVMHGARALYAWELSAKSWLTLDCGDIIWCTADTGWSKAGTSILFGPFSRGATTVLHDGPFDAQKRFEIIERLKVNVFCAAATELRRLIIEPAPNKFSHLRLTVSAGESVNPDVVIRWKELTGVDVLDGYGQTETLMTITNTVGRTIKPGSMGQPLSGIEIAVLTSSGAIGGVGAAGQLLIKTPNPQLMLGYYGDEERTAASYVQVDEVTWFQTGDNVEIDEDGYVFYVGRTDDVINSSGYRIGPQEVENVLVAHPAVQECAVVGHPDKDRGEIVVAFIVLAPGVEALPDLTRDLQQYVKQLTAPYKYPRRIEFVADLPKTVSGKLRRNLLRSLLAEMG